MEARAMEAVAAVVEVEEEEVRAVEVAAAEKEEARAVAAVEEEARAVAEGVVEGHSHYSRPSRPLMSRCVE